MTPPMTIAHSGRAEGGFRSERAPRRGVHGPPLIPPPTQGGPRDPDRMRTRGGECAGDKRGARVGNRGPPPRGGAGRPRPDPPPPKPPHRPASRGGAGPHPPRQGGWSFLPPPERGAGVSPPPRPSCRLPQEPRGPSEPAPTRQDAAQIAPREGGRARTGVVLGPRPHASDTRFVACPGKAEGRNEEEQPPALLAPPAAQTGGTAHGRHPPPPKPAPRHTNATDPPHGGRTARSQVGGAGTGPPPPKHARWSKGLAQDTRRGTDHVERPYQRPVPGPREVHTPHLPGGGGGSGCSGSASAHTRKGHAGTTRGQPERARGTHRPRGMVNQRARVRDTRTGRRATRSAGHAGREGGNGTDTSPGTDPSQANQPRAPRAHRRGTPPAKAVVAHCATPQPLG